MVCVRELQRFRVYNGRAGTVEILLLLKECDIIFGQAGDALPVVGGVNNE